MDLKLKPQMIFATPKQITFMETLCNDLNCRNRKESLALIGDIVGRELHFFGDVTKNEASDVIDNLKRRLKV